MAGRYVVKVQKRVIHRKSITGANPKIKVGESTGRSQNRIIQS